MDNRLLLKKTKTKTNKKTKEKTKERLVHVIYAALYTPDMATHGVPGLVPRPCGISCRQNIYCCLLRGLIRQK